VLAGRDRQRGCRVKQAGERRDRLRAGDRVEQTRRSPLTFADQQSLDLQRRNFSITLGTASH